MNRVWVSLLLLSIILAPARAQTGSTIVNGIAVIVNEKVITEKDVYMAMREEAEFLQRRYAGQPREFDERIKRLKAERVEELVEHQLVLHEFNAMAKPLPESYIENRINEDIKKYGDRLTLMKTLQAEGITFENYRQRIRENITLQLMWNAKVPLDPVISPAKIENYYIANSDKFKVDDRVKLRLIVFTNAASLNLARELTKKIDEGTPFAELAKVYSQDSSAGEGGDKGWLERKALREELANVAFALKPGARSDPIVVGNNVFLAFVEQAEPAHVRSLTEVREEIERALKAEETTRLRKLFVERLKKKSFVRYF